MQEYCSKHWGCGTRGGQTNFPGRPRVGRKEGGGVSEESNLHSTEVCQNDVSPYGDQVSIPSKDSLLISLGPLRQKNTPSCGEGKKKTAKELPRCRERGEIGKEVLRREGNGSRGMCTNRGTFRGSLCKRLKREKRNAEGKPGVFRLMTHPSGVGAIDWKVCPARKYKKGSRDNENSGYRGGEFLSSERLRLTENSSTRKTPSSRKKIK